MDASSASIVRGVYGGTSAPTLTNAATIAGTGLIDNLAITNTGLIDAEGSGWGQGLGSAAIVVIA